MGRCLMDRFIKNPDFAVENLKRNSTANSRFTHQHKKRKLRSKHVQINFFSKNVNSRILKTTD